MGRLSLEAVSGFIDVTVAPVSIKKLTGSRGGSPPAGGRADEGKPISMVRSGPTAGSNDSVICGTGVPTQIRRYDSYLLDREQPILELALSEDKGVSG